MEFDGVVWLVGIEVCCEDGEWYKEEEDKCVDDSVCKDDVLVLVEG